MPKPVVRTISFRCLRNVVMLHDVTYPMYCGFARPIDLRAIATAPAFGDKTPNHQLAAHTLTMPIEEWQRPLDTDRIKNIASFFNKTHDLMPNPVLLSENALGGGNVSVSPTLLQDSSTGPTFDISIDVCENPYPLWILDG